MKRKNFFSVMAAMTAILFAVSFTACGDKDDGKKPGGGDEKTDPNEIAKDNLVAYFAFDDNGDDVKGLTPAQTGTAVSYVAGRRGKAFQGAENAYFLYDLPQNHKLRDLKEFSFSMWIKLVATIDGGPEPMIFQVDGDTDWIWGNFFFLQNRNTVDENGVAGPSPLCTYFWNDNGTSVVWQGNRANKLNAPSYDRWIHVICTYSKTTSKFHTYFNGAVYTEDGEPYSGTDRFKDGTQDPETQEWTGTTPAGELKFKNVTKLSIGRWMGLLNGGLQPTDAWAADFTGQLDELRFYDRGLTADEAKALYDAEVENID